MLVRHWVKTLKVRRKKVPERRFGAFSVKKSAQYSCGKTRDLCHLRVRISLDPVLVLLLGALDTLLYPSVFQVPALTYVFMFVHEPRLICIQKVRVDSNRL
jgi:hypothetical protein